VLFIVDIVLTLNMPYFDSKKNLVTDRYRIFINYLSGWLLLDLLTSLPIDVFIQYFIENLSTDEIINYIH
jgi:hypothetical protein